MKAVIKHQGLARIIYWCEFPANNYFPHTHSQLHRNLVFSQYRLPYLISMPQAAWVPVIFLIIASITGWAGLFKGLLKEALKGS